MFFSLATMVCIVRVVFDRLKYLFKGFFQRCVLNPQRLVGSTLLCIDYIHFDYFVYIELG